MAAVKPLKIETGKRKRWTTGDFLAVIHGGTGITACVLGDLLLGSGANTLAALNIGTAGQVLTVVGGTAVWAEPASSDDQTMTAAATVIAGEPVYASAADTFDKARADSATTSIVIGLAKSGIAAAATGTIRTGGVLTLTTGEWDAVAGTTGGLAFGVKYFLSAAVAGRITATAPDATGNELSYIGVALSTVDLKLSTEMGDPITL